jgi:hypothetical protein
MTTKRHPAKAVAGKPLAGTLLVLLLLAASGRAIAAERLDGFNVIVASGHPFGSPTAFLALSKAKRLGAGAAAIVPFLWQAAPASGDIVRGSDMSDEELRAAIRQAHAAGLAAIVKPHIWVPESWAGAVEPATDAAWRTWFDGYARATERLARIAAEEHAEAFAIGTEVQKTTQRPEWLTVIATVRAAYPGTLTYYAHNVSEMAAVPFWDRLDAVGVTLYPPLGDDEDRAGRLARMQEVADALEAFAARAGKPILVGEIGLRSAVGAAAKPWESAEERDSPPDPKLQADVIGDWLAALDRPAIHGILIWRWFTDPAAGGLADTDFTVQGKPAETVLLCAWTRRCGAR